MQSLDKMSKQHSLFYSEIPKADRVQKYYYISWGDVELTHLGFIQ